MLTNEDIKNLIAAQEKVFATKEELNNGLENIRKDFLDLQTSVDAYSKKADTYYLEMTSLSSQVDRHDRWIQGLAKKVDVGLDY